MKQQRFRYRVLTIVIIILLGISGLYGVYSISAYGNRWSSNSRNTRYRSAQNAVIAGDISDRYGRLLATTDAQGERQYHPDVTNRSALVHVLGDSQGYVANGVESFQANYLLGFETSLTERVIALLKGETKRGDDISLTIDAQLQTLLLRYWQNSESLKQHTGAIVVMNYQTGEVLSMISFPTFDPINITQAVREDDNHPFWNRATQALLPPGSTFKIITATSALQNIDNVLNSTFHCSGETQVGEHVIKDYHNAKHGDISLERAFMVSCNNTFAQIALLESDASLRKTAQDFGFNDNFLFRDLVVSNSIYPTKNRTKKEIGWSGVGQSAIVSTPLHMCMIAGAIANDGIMMEPRLLHTVTTPTNKERLSFSSKVYRRALPPEQAHTIDKFMKQVVRKGTGTQAQVPGLTIAGKTGSAEGNVDGRAVTHAWFVGYSDHPSYPYAVSVLVEEGDSGGAVAAPVASYVFSQLISQP